MSDNVDLTFLVTQVERLRGNEASSLQTGGGGGTSGGMESRVTRLEEQMNGVRDDLREIKDTLKVLNTLPTKTDLNTWRFQWIATGVAIVALTVGGITGGLALIGKSTPGPSPSTAQPQPIIIQLPAAAAPQRAPQK